MAKPPSAHTSHDASPMSGYSKLHAPPKTGPGGCHLGLRRSKYHCCIGLLKMESTNPSTSGMPTAMYRLFIPSLAAAALAARGAATTAPRLATRSLRAAGSLSSPPVTKLEPAAPLHTPALAPAALAIAIAIALPLHILGVSQHLADTDILDVAVTLESASIAMSTDCPLPIPIPTCYEKLDWLSKNARNLNRVTCRDVGDCHYGERTTMSLGFVV